MPVISDRLSFFPYTHTHTQSKSLFSYVLYCGSFTAPAVHRWGWETESQFSATVTSCDRVSLCFLGNTYKYQAGNKMNALLWFKHLSAACQSNRQQVTHIHTLTHTYTHTNQPSHFSLSLQVPANLMSFE